MKPNDKRSVTTMKDVTKIRFLVLAAVATVTMLAPAAATAQGRPTRAEVMTAVAQLHQAQMAFFKRYATDDKLAGQFDAALGAKNYDAAAALAAQATGVPRANIEVSAPQGTKPVGITTPSVDGVQLAAFTVRGHGPSAEEGVAPAERMPTTGKICFELVLVWGCISW
jgi:hypothetical protein